MTRYVISQFKEMENLIKAYRAFNEEQRANHHNSFDRLMKQFTSALVLEQPYRLILDSNILMNIQNLGDNPTPDQLAILLFFDFLNFQKTVNVSILLRPSVFYEFYKQEKICNEIEHWVKYRNLKKLIEERLNIQVYSEGLADFETANKNISLLSHDISLIVRNLKEIYSKDWSIDFIRKFGEVDGFLLKDSSGILSGPHQLAMMLAPEIESKFLNRKVIKFCLANHISHLISTNKSNDQSVINRYTDKEDFSFRKIVIVDKGDKLKGVADLDLFYLCNLQNQFDYQAFDNYHPSSIPLTLDKDLFKCIGKFSSMVINSYFMGGEAEDSIRMKFDKEREEKKRIQRASKRLELIYKNEKYYYLRLHELMEQD